MIYFNGTEFVAHEYKATYTNAQDSEQRVKYASDKAYWNEFVSKWGSNLVWQDVTLTTEQQARLDLINEQAHCCGQFDAQATLFVEQGVIHTDDVPPYLEALVGEYGVEPADENSLA